MPDLRTLVDEHISSPGSPAGEAHVVGEDTADKVFLDEVPDPASAVTIPGYTKVAGAPAASEFQLIDNTNELRFNAADAGDAVAVSYTSWGSKLRARDLNRVHQKLKGVKTVADGATVSLDFRDEWMNKVTLGGNRNVDVLAGAFPPAGSVVGFEVHQDGTGSRTITWDATDFDGGTAGFPTLTTTAGDFDLLTFYSNGSKLFYIGSALGFTP